MTCRLGIIGALLLAAVLLAAPVFAQDAPAQQQASVTAAMPDDDGEDAVPEPDKAAAALAPSDEPKPQAAAPSAPADPIFDTLRAFYAGRGHKPVWTDGDAFTAAGRALPDFLAVASAHGIDPQTYDVAAMRDMLAAKKPVDAQGWQRAELLWTYNLWQFASDLAGRALDAATLENVVEGDVADNLTALAPDTPLYKGLQNNLAALDKTLAQAGAAPAPLDFGRGLFKPGRRADDVARLRDRMKDYGAMAVKAGGDASVYDDTLAKAVIRFQKEYGLKSDGTIGPETLAVLNRDARAQRMQVVANLQRLREPHRRAREDTRIEVSIARYMLTAYDNGAEALSMPVIVGKPGRQTISFRTEISGVRLNPTWSVPDTIKREDFLPMLVKDPARMLRQHEGIKVVHDGQNVDPVSFDWSQLSGRQLMQLRFWRPAGDGNPLGRYRVIMANPYDIYLHDTNRPDLFDSSARAQSSGCVRVSKPAELTQFILNHKSGWEPQKTKEIIKSGRTTDVVMEKKIPIYLDYMTAWLDSRNQVVLGVDVYGLDKPRYDGLVKHVLTTQRNAQKILDRVTDILSPELQEAQHRDPVLTQATN